MRSRTECSAPCASTHRVRFQRWSTLHGRRRARPHPRRQKYQQRRLPRRRQWQCAPTTKTPPVRPPWARHRHRAPTPTAHSSGRQPQAARCGLGWEIRATPGWTHLGGQSAHTQTWCSTRDRVWVPASCPSRYRPTARFISTGASRCQLPQFCRLSFSARPLLYLQVCPVLEIQIQIQIQKILVTQVKPATSC